MSAFKSFLYFGLFFFVSATANAEVKILVDENFDSGLVKVPGLGLGSQGGGKVEIVSDPAVQINSKSAGALKAIYPVGTGGIYGWASFDMTPYKTREVYVEFNAKMPAAKQGLKFLKIFGERDAASGGYANTTFGLDYTGIAAGKGTLSQVGFGDGSSLQNDVQNVINFNGSNPSWVGRSYGKATVKTPENRGFTAAEWGDKWHHFRFKVKFNSAAKNADNSYTEVNDGEYFVQINGKVYVDATGLFNRHPSNGPIAKVALLDWSQNIDQSFEIWYDNVKITTGGFDTSGDPSPEKIEPKLK